MPRGFVPPSKPAQLAGIGINGRSRELVEKELYSQLKVPKKAAAAGAFYDALYTSLDPAAGHWEDIEPPRPSEWLEAMLDKTPDQSFKTYVASRPNRPDRCRKVLYLLPICDPSDLEAPPFPQGPWPSWHVLQGAAERFFAPMTVRTLPAVPMQQLSPKPPSRQGSWGVEQFDATVALNGLARRVPSDAYGLMAVTMCDLYPRPEWNFVYGLARLHERVGIFSFCRHTPGNGPAAWCGAQLLHRSLKTMLHEIGHMFGMKHCTFYNCLMRGSNGESVEHQTNYLHLCPVCLRKLHWCIGFDIRDRYASLLEVYQEYGKVHELFERDCTFLQNRLAALEELPAGSTMISELPSWNLSAMDRMKCPPVPADKGNTMLARRSRATSTPSLARNRTKIIGQNVSQSQAEDPDCPCCDPRKEDIVGLQMNFSKGVARKQKQLDRVRTP